MAQKKEQSQTQTAALLKVLADETRLQLLALLRQDAGGQTGAQLLTHVKVGQPTLSHHMKLLCDARLVQAHRAGKQIEYRLCTAGCAKVWDALRLALPIETATQEGFAPSVADSADVPQDASTVRPKEEAKAKTPEAPLRGGSMPMHLL